MSEHTLGFYLLELQRTKSAFEEARLVYELSLSRTAYHTALLSLLRKYNSNTHSKKRLQRILKQHKRYTQLADNNYCATAMDYLAANSKLQTQAQDIITTAEDLAYNRITSQKKSRSWWQIKSKQR